jgi:hypothetical protein
MIFDPSLDHCLQIWNMYHILITGQSSSLFYKIYIKHKDLLSRGDLAHHQLRASIRDMKSHYLSPDYLESKVVRDASLFNMTYILMLIPILGPYITSSKPDFNNGHNG